MATTITTTKMSSPPQTSPTSPQVRTTTTEQTGIHYSTIYLHTVPGTLKVICLVWNFFPFVIHIEFNNIFNDVLIYRIYVIFFLQIFVLIGFILVQCSDHSGAGIAQFFSTIAMIAFWFTGILLVLYLFHAIYVFHKIPWIKIEFYFCVGATLFLMLASALIAAKGVGLFTAAAVSVSNRNKLNRLFYFFFSKVFIKYLSYLSLYVPCFQFFGFVAMCAYGYDAFLKYRQYNVVVTNVVTRTTTVTVA